MCNEIIYFIKRQKRVWLGYVKQVENEKAPKKKIDWKSTGIVPQQANNKN